MRARGFVKQENGEITTKGGVPLKEQLQKLIKRGYSASEEAQVIEVAMKAYGEFGQVTGQVSVKRSDNTTYFVKWNIAGK